MENIKKEGKKKIGFYNKWNKQSNYKMGCEYERINQIKQNIKFIFFFRQNLASNVGTNGRMVSYNQSWNEK